MKSFGFCKFIKRVGIILLIEIDTIHIGTIIYYSLKNSHCNKQVIQVNILDIILHYSNTVIFEAVIFAKDYYLHKQDN